MKKIITTGLIVSAIIVSQTSAMNYEIMPISNTEPAIISDDLKTDVNLTPTQKLLKKYELVLRNNRIESDYKYNSKTYYTSKIKTDNLIVPDEIKKESKKIYFLVEEWNDRVYFKNSAMMMDEELEVEEIKKEYNYKIVDFKEWQKEYTFKNKDLIKDFWEWEYSNISITLIAEISDTVKVPLTNSVYVSVNTKENVLNNLKDEKKEKYSYFGYYNSNDLEEYLEKLSTKISRDNYKIILTKADKKIEKWLDDNEKIKENIIKSIKKESDFKKYVEKYSIYSETELLFSSLSRAVKNQLQNIRAFNVIDSILK